MWVSNLFCEMLITGPHFLEKVQDIETMVKK